MEWTKDSTEQLRNGKAMRTRTSERSVEKLDIGAEGTWQAEAVEQWSATKETKGPRKHRLAPITLLTYFS